MSTPEGELSPVLPRISDYPFHHARLKPEAEALVGGDTRLTWRDLAKTIERCARALLAAGVARGDRVAMLSTPRTDFVVVFMATARISAIWVGLNPRHRLEELSYVITDAAPKVLFAIPGFEGRDYAEDLTALTAPGSPVQRLVTFDDGLPGLSTGFDAFLAEGEAAGDEAYTAVVAAVTRDDPACIVYTSGSTGEPKGALLPHRGLVRSYGVQWARWRVDPLRVINNHPINHIGGLGDTNCYALIAGGTQVFTERFDAREFLAVTERERITLWGQVVTIFEMVTRLPDWENHDLSSLQFIWWGGAPAPASLIEIITGICPRNATFYGMTETCGSVTYVDPEASLEEKAVTIGRPIPEVDVRLGDAAGREVPRGEPGEIQVRGDFVMLGYLNRPEATAEVIDPDGWFHTGDLALQRADGNYEVVGRLKEMFKSGGYNIYPREIEVALETHPGVALAAVVPVPDDLYQEVGNAFVIANPDAGLDGPALDRWCRERLANYKVPKRFFVCDELPLVSVGKIDKVALRAVALAEAGVSSPEAGRSDD